MSKKNITLELRTCRQLFDTRHTPDSNLTLSAQQPTSSHPSNLSSPAVDISASHLLNRPPPIRKASPSHVYLTLHLHLILLSHITRGPPQRTPTPPPHFAHTAAPNLSSTQPLVLQPFVLHTTTLRSLSVTSVADDLYPGLVLCDSVGSFLQMYT